MGQLSHLYIIEPNKVDYDEFCLGWLKQVFKEFVNTNSDNIIDNHQDILNLQLEKDAKQYNKNNLQDIFEFITYKAVSLKQKFLIISDVHKLSEINSNKLLKTFEEPPIELSIFLINSQKSKMLPTITSRAVQLKLIKPETKKENFLSSLPSPTPEFLDFSKLCEAQEITIHELLSNLIELYGQSCHNFGQLNQLKSDINSIQEDMLYNNSSQYIKLKIYNAFIQLK